MQILKFGESSVADASNIANVVKIVKGSVKKDRTIVVTSAISGCTDSLIQIGKLASVQDIPILKLIDNLEFKHLQIIEDLIPLDFQPAIDLK